MPRDDKSSKKRSKTRNLDEESGMKRTQSRTTVQPPKYSVDTEPEDDGNFTDSSVEEFLQKSHKDDSRAPKPKPKPKGKRNLDVRPTNAPEEADDEDVDKVEEQKQAETSSHMEMLLAATYRLGFVKRDYPHKSQYIPDTGNLFTTLSEMLTTASSNSRLHEVYPAFTSIAIQVYYAHAVFYHILRVRQNCGELGRIERRAHRAYEQIGAPESWPVATPLIGYFQALGSIIPEGGKYGQILPALPNYGTLTEKKGLTGLHSTQGAGRLPLVPALVKYLYNYAHNLGKFETNDGYYYPLKAKKLEDADGKRFIGLNDSKKDNYDFQSLAHSSSWFHAKESEIDTFMMSTQQKQMLTKRWGVRTFNDTDDLRGLDQFLGLDEDKQPNWMINLLKCATAFNDFFPGSVTLATVPLISRVENVSQITVTSRAGTDRTVEHDDVWFTTRNNWQIALKGTVIREDSQRAYQAAAALMIRPTYTAQAKPAAAQNSLKDRTYGTDDGYFYADSKPSTEMENTAQDDPMILIGQIIDSKMYDRFGGRKN
jgi:hypothetical protein